MSFYFSKVLSYHETWLGKLRETQKLKVEELKKKTSYYQTKGLIERYDPSNTNPKQPSPSKLPLTNSAVQSSQSSPKFNTPTSPSEITLQPPRQTMAVDGKRSFFDRIADALLGEDQNNLKFALICEKCFSHNGLAKPEEIEKIQYYCPKCLHFNNSKKVDSTSTIVNKQESLSPLSQARIKAKTKSRDTLLATSKSHEFSPGSREKLLEEEKNSPLSKNHPKAE